MLLSVLLPVSPSRRWDGLSVDVIKGPGFHVVLGQPFKVDVHVSEIEASVGGNCGRVSHLHIRHRPDAEHRPQLGDLGAKHLDLGIEERV